MAGMARPLRMESEAGVYHVLNRGNYRSDIFRGEKTRQAFLQCLDQACVKTGWQIHAWCLMSNHYHRKLRLEFKQGPLSALLRVRRSPSCGRGKNPRDRR
jgi:REP element-mobilizing transposase RayT